MNVEELEERIEKLEEQVKHKAGLFEILAFLGTALLVFWVASALF